MPHTALPLSSAEARSPWWLAALLTAALAAPALSVAQTVAPALAAPALVGEIESVRGVGFAQTPGQAPRILSKGTPLQEGDRLTTAPNAVAVLLLKDGTRMTLRPETDMVMTQFRYSQGAADNSMLLNLIKGGLRALTGLISKSSPNAARIQTSTATVGIRGTDFDARLCQRDCATESKAIGGEARPTEAAVSARVILLQGEALAINPAGLQRKLSNGAPIFVGEVVETGPAAHAVLAFRDDSRLTLGATTRFRIDQFAYDAEHPQAGRFLVSLLRGSLRALTGLIGKANTRNVAFSTATATVGIRGTGLDLVCTGTCANETEGEGQGFQAYTWLGSIEVTPGGQTLAQVLQSGQGVFISNAGLRATTGITGPSAINPPPRPDGVMPPPGTFSTTPVGDTEDGLYINMRDGHITVTTASGVLQLGRDEVGVVRPDGSLARAQRLPRFIEFDRVPLPSTQQFNVRSLLNNAGFGEAQQCK